MGPQYAQENVTEAEGSLSSRFVVASSGTRANSRQNVVAFKFGGSSLLGADRMLHAAGLVREAAQAASVIVVVSAMKGVTDRLLSISRCPRRRQAFPRPQ